MGDPRKARKKYQTPSHPWRKERIDSEKELSKTYGLPRKREIWKFSSELNRYKTQAKKLVAIYNEQSKKEQELLIKRLVRYGLLKGSATLDDVLGLDVKDLLERRLQTLVYKKGLARTIDQARQLIVHGHIFVNGQKVTVPSFLVSAEDESKIIFNPKSNFNNEEHPERVIKKQEVKTQTKIEKKEKVQEEEVKEEENGKAEISAE